jgi:hypothetical protein
MDDYGICYFCRQASDGHFECTGCDRVKATEEIEVTKDELKSNDI